MQSSLLSRLAQLSERFEELNGLLSQAEIIHNQERYRDLSKEYAELEPVIQAYQHYQQAEATLDELILWTKGTDLELKTLAQDEYPHAKQQLQHSSEQLQTLLLPRDPNDHRNIYIEVRAGTGGDEAAIFAGDLFRMYARFSENQGWQLELINENLGEHGGYKEVIARIQGRDVYSQLKFESGAHRVQRVPATESQGRIHTSACTVAIMPEVDEVDAVDLDPSLLRIDTYRASGAGGQHVNRTDSAVRITHLPTGTVVECQEERSQHKNKARALALLGARILAREQEKQRAEQALTRKLLVGSGDRSERIRTYNFPQGRITDHRINLTLYKLNEVMQGELKPIIEPLLQAHLAEELAQFND